MTHNETLVAQHEKSITLLSQLTQSLQEADRARDESIASIGTMIREMADRVAALERSVQELESR